MTMNSESLKQLAERLRSNPSLFEDVDDELLCEAMLLYVNDDLSEADTAEMEALIKSDDRAKEVLTRFRAADEYAASPEGQAATERLLSRVLPQRRPQQVQAPANSTIFNLLEDLAAALGEFFTSRATMATASGDDSFKKKLPDGKTQFAVHTDSAGRLWVRITSTANEFRDGSFKLEVERAPSILTFTEIEPGLYSARVSVDKETAEDLKLGAKPKLTPLSPPEDETNQ